MKPNYSHNYRTCAHSLKRESAPWRVTGGCKNRACLCTGRHYELPNHTLCLTCPFYRRDGMITTKGVEKEKHDESKI